MWKFLKEKKKCPSSAKTCIITEEIFMQIKCTLPVHSARKFSAVFGATS
jgi:hypothetical protein